MSASNAITSSALAPSPSPSCENRIEEPASLLVFADDWGRHPSSCQHLVRELLGDWPVCWVNTIGTRAPKFNLATARRAVEKLAQWSRSPSQRESAVENLSVLSPRMWPWFRRPHDRWLNRKLLGRTLSAAVRAMPQPVAAVTTLPIAADLVGELPVDRWIYYCVDDFSKWPGLDQATMEIMERKLIAEVDAIVAVSDDLCRRIGQMGREAALLTHGVDLGHWRSNAACHPPRPMSALPRPLVTFWGLIDRRLDIEFIETLSRRLLHGTIAFVGPTDDADPRLFRLPRVVHVPAVAYAALPSVAHASDVLVMPYADLEVTRAMQPLKLKEYLATGRPVVVRNLPSTGSWADCLDLAATPDEFADVVLARLGGEVPREQAAARCRLEHESWRQKAAEFRRLVVRARKPKVERASVSSEATCR